MDEPALKLESLLPAAMVTLFRNVNEEDPLKHLSIGQIRLMRTLMNGEQSATHLCQKLGMSPSALTQMAARLISAGLVEKQLGPDDRRVRVLCLSPTGKELMTQRRKLRAKNAAAVLRHFPAHRTQELIMLLQELVELKHAQADLNEVLV
jgi:DNA-binding MarR family transcriptional regulator